MSVFIPTTTVTIQRGDEEPDEYGDVLPSSTAIASGVPAAVTEGLTAEEARKQRTFQLTEGRSGVIEEYTIRLRPDVDISEGDRIVDERTGAVYQARIVYSPQSVVGMADVRVIAERTGSASLPVNG